MLEGSECDDLFKSGERSYNPTDVSCGDIHGHCGSAIREIQLIVTTTGIECSSDRSSGCKVERIAR